MDTRPIRTHRSKNRLHKTLKNIELTMRDHRFSGEDYVFVFDFLTRVVEEADTFGMNEKQLIVFLLDLLTKNAAHYFRSTSGHSCSRGMVCYRTQFNAVFVRTQPKHPSTNRPNTWRTFPKPLTKMKTHSHHELESQPTDVATPTRNWKSWPYS